jgi:deazaflavin-dependent oxidoreductase (nitroreductase family)
MGTIGNGFMKLFLRTPGLQRLLGRSLALLTVTGRTTGRTYTIPVSYARADGSVIVLTRRSRSWWRNLEAVPGVRLRLAGRSVSGKARVGIPGDADEGATLTSFLTGRRFDAKAYGVALQPDGRPDEADVRALLPRVVVIRITPVDDGAAPDVAADGRVVEARPR